MQFIGYISLDRKDLAGCSVRRYIHKAHLSTWDKAVLSIIDLEDSSYCSDCSPACISFCLFPSRLPIVLDYLVYPPSTSMTTE